MDKDRLIGWIIMMFVAGLVVGCDGSFVLLWLLCMTVMVVFGLLLLGISELWLWWRDDDEC